MDTEQIIISQDWTPDERKVVINKRIQNALTVLEENPRDEARAIIYTELRVALFTINSDANFLNENRGNILHGTGYA